jgi:PIN domain nuclease of toxin-antitoxin system
VKRALLDTHAFLWFVFDDPRLSKTADELISNDKIEKYISIASLWEIAIKQQIGKLKLGMDFENFLADFVMAREIEVLSIDPAHIIAYSRLPLHHRDPFDRLLVAQAQTAKLPIVSADKNFGLYEVAVSW